MEKKKMGRPTDDPKTIVKRARMSEDDVKKLNECCDILQLTASDVIKDQSISLVLFLYLKMQGNSIYIVKNATHVIPIQV